MYPGMSRFTSGNLLLQGRVCDENGELLHLKQAFVNHTSCNSGLGCYAKLIDMVASFDLYVLATSDVISPTCVTVTHSWPLFGDAIERPGRQQFPNFPILIMHWCANHYITLPRYPAHTPLRLSSSEVCADYQPIILLTKRPYFIHVLPLPPIRL